MKKFLSLLFVLVVAAGTTFAQKVTVGTVTVEPQGSYTPDFACDGINRAPLNVILMIGDGMGMSHVASAMYANGGELTLTNLHTFGWSRTQSSSDFTTDSAASGTAYAAGVKTYNGAIGMGPDHKPVQNLPEKLAGYGIVSGVISTDNLDGATPAAFFAHQENRNMSDEIWSDLPDSKLVFAAAGSKQSFERRPYETVDEINKSFTVVETLDDPAIAKARRVAYFPDKAETASKEEDGSGRGDFLPATTAYAIDFLKSKCNRNKGFFLMVEGARIDKSSHNNNFAEMVHEVLDFDKAVEAAIRFAEKDGNTLVVVSADHETGALTLRSGDPSKGEMGGTFVSGSHTPSPVPIYVYGPMSKEFARVMENSEVSNKIFELIRK